LGTSSRAGGRYRLGVADTGVGIGEADLRRIFEKFFRVENEQNREVGGTGLGLALVQHIATVHGGVAQVTSTLGRGSFFSLELPRQARPPEAAGETSDRAGAEAGAVFGVPPVGVGA